MSDDGTKRMWEDSHREFQAMVKQETQRIVAPEAALDRARITGIIEAATIARMASQRMLNIPDLSLHEMSPILAALADEILALIGGTPSGD
jgi:hypothetical protein